MSKTLRALHHLATWHVHSVERSRHNAGRAAAALAERRREREEVEEFLARHLRSHPPAAEDRPA